MSLTQLNEHDITDFGTNWEFLLQQGDSRLDGKCRVLPVNGKERTISQLGQSKMTEITTRNGKTIASDSPMAKRWVRPVGFATVTHIDEFDDDTLGDLGAPTSEHVVSHAMAANRTMDEVKIGALEGTSFIGETGVDPVVLPASQQVAVNYVKSGAPANSGLTLAKLLRAKFILDANEVPQDRRYLVHSAMQLNDLLNDVEEVKNFDYNNVKALVDGTVNRFSGFEFVMTQLLTLNTSTDVRTCIAYEFGGLVLGTGKNKSVKITERDDLNNTTQIRTVLSIGATRTEEERVVLLFCDESP